MTIKKGEPINFSPSVVVTFLIKSKASDGFEFKGVVQLIRDDDNTITLTRFDGSKVFVPGNSYDFFEVRADTDDK